AYVKGLIRAGGTSSVLSRWSRYCLASALAFVSACSAAGVARYLLSSPAARYAFTGNVSIASKPHEKKQKAVSLKPHWWDARSNTTNGTHESAPHG
ncbi:hypothetical protein U1Q18_047822, partial [Sarracenia purpurea var. burkii]